MYLKKGPSHLSYSDHTNQEYHRANNKLKKKDGISQLI